MVSLLEGQESKNSQLNISKEQLHHAKRAGESKRRGWERERCSTN
jgi:hypothetical protein